jgi:hypothetical protein
VQLRHAGRLDRDDRRVRGERSDLAGGQLEELRPHPRRRQLGGERLAAGLGLGASLLPGRSGHGLDRDAALGRAALHLVARSKRRGGAHRRIGAHELRHAVEGVSRRVHDVAVLGRVAEDGRSRPPELRQPFLLHRPDELDEHQRLAAVRSVLAGQRRPRGRVDRPARQLHVAHVVATSGPGSAQRGVVLAHRLDQ